MNEKDLNIVLDNELRSSGGFLRLKGEKPFAKRVNEILRNHWINTGRELNIENVILEVLAEKYNSSDLK